MSPTPALTSLDAQFDTNIKSSDIAAYVTSALLAELNESTRVVPKALLEPVVVLLPSTTYAGKIFRPEDQPIIYAMAQGIDLTQSPFCLFHQPALVRVSPADSKQDARQVVLDLAAPLVSHIPLLQTVFNMSSSEFSFRAIFPNHETWLHSQMSLLEHHFDHNIAFLDLVHMKAIQSRWKEIVVGGETSRPERVGYLYKQAFGGSKREAKLQAPSVKLRSNRHHESVSSHTSSTNGTLLGLAVGEEGSRNFKSLRKKSKRWFALKGLFLGCFKSRDDALPSLVIPLDYYIVRLSDDFKKGERVMSLDKCVSSFPKGLLGDFVLGTELENENELRLWFQSTNGKCANTALNRVFGMPLLHQLCHNQYGYVKHPSLGLEDPLFRIPPFLTRCLKYLSSDGIDHEGLFRISHTPAEVLAYREYFDTGVEIDLHGTSPHCVAALIKAWIRELPEPLLPHHLYTAFLQAVSATKDNELKVERVFQIAESVPLHSLRTLSYLATFMKKVVSYTVLNKMTYSSLAIVTGPGILRPQTESCADDDRESEEYNPLQLLKETPLINEVISLLYENSERLAHLVEQVEQRIAISESKEDSPKSHGNLSSSQGKSTQSQQQQQPALQQIQRANSTPKTTLVQLQNNGTGASAGASSEENGKGALKLNLGGVKELRRRSSSTQVILSLNEELPPLKEGQITIFTPSGVTPTVTIEPSPRSLRSSSPKWGKKVRNQSQWKGGMVGGGHRSGSTSPVPPMDGTFGEHGSNDENARRGSLDHSTLHAPLGDPHKPSVALALGLSSNAHDSANFAASASGGGLSPRSVWSQPVSPDPEARLLSMIMALQQSHELLVSRVGELEERLAQEVAQRTAMELKLLSMASK